MDVPNPPWQRQCLPQVSAASAAEQGDPARHINTAQYCLQEHRKKHKVLIWTPKIPIRSSDREICQNKRDAQISHRPYSHGRSCVCAHMSQSCFGITGDRADFCEQLLFAPQQFHSYRKCLCLTLFMWCKPFQVY